MKPNWFVGLPVDSKSWLYGVLASLPAACRAFDPDDTHMTLAFLGAMPPGRKDDVLQVMNRIESKPVSIRLGSVRPLPSVKRVSALSFELVQGRERINDLIARWRGPLIDAARGKPDHRPPLAHVTVARPIRSEGAAGRTAALAWAREIQPPETEIIIDRVALYTWAGDRRIRQFQIVAEKLFVEG